MKKKRVGLYCAVYMIIRRNEKILFLRRQNTGYMDGVYALPAGHKDGGETFVEAVIREAKEELGILTKEDDLELVFTGNQIAPDREYVDLFFEIKNFDGKIENKEPQKASELDFFDFDKIENSVIPYTAKVLRAIENKKNFLATRCDI